MAAGTFEREELLDEIITGYLQAAAGGQIPDRQALLDRHPELADDLAEFFTAQDEIHQVARPLRLIARVIDGSPAPEVETLVAVQGGDGPLLTGQPFGSYELLDRLGSGGMGVVYRARQKGLNRQVALKIIRAAELAS